MNKKFTQFKWFAATLNARGGNANALRGVGRWLDHSFKA